ncbi:enoyl-CoA hydratase/isomerase family protein [Mycolicibacterium sp. P9-22]|uniref:enoyl-CoA hydratase/isomerase family protein n=1 Tax=Mycolicibacterium sp. P9-22 TaxID=2024613 RepID=UPI0011EFE756|nr:enoyl-CoA hydratase-related protein [Mycolicibacterium sp. P9-22]KAA0120513.1 enoyl-CoA hydratase [Mycolicibacterium sp. P9-22]
MPERLNDSIVFSTDDSVARITLDGGPGNPITCALADGLAAAVDRCADSIEDGRARVVVIDAEGSAFCVGGDLNEFAAATDRGEHIRQLADVMHQSIGALADIAVPVVSVVQGTVAGGGIGIALAADIILMADSASMHLAYTAIGLSPDCGVTWRLKRNLSSAKAFDIALTNRPLSAREAAEAGLISRAVPLTELKVQEQQILSVLSRGPRSAYAETKRLINGSAEVSLKTHLDDEASTIARMAASADGIEGVDAFLGKRSPGYQ